MKINKYPKSKLIDDLVHLGLATMTCIISYLFYKYMGFEKGVVFMLGIIWYSILIKK
jgi:hypothetical protein